jgi:acyl-coenzyme A thioesterase PaaI-like protein
VSIDRPMPPAGPDGLVEAFFPRSPGGVGLCFGCHDRGECRLGLTGYRIGADGVAEVDLTCPRGEQGGPEVAHGGWTAAAFDEALGHLPLRSGHFAVTAELSVRYRRQIPVERPLLARSWVDRREGSRWHISGEMLMLPGRAVLAEATGVWVVRDLEHFEKHQQWLAEQDSAE